MTSTAAYNRAWRTRNPEKVKAANAKRWADGSTKTYRKTRKAHIESTRLKRQFNISLDTYLELLQDQRCRCAICGRHQSEVKLALVVDHDRSCCPGASSCGGCVRGLLCTACNLVIGNAEDSVRLLESAVKYLRRLS